MKRFLAGTIVTALLVAGAAAQKNPEAPILLEKGTLIYVELGKTIDAKKAKPGDEVNATLLADVVSHGKVVLRSESKLLGRVTESQAHTKDTPESRLGIVFDHAVPKGGQEIGFQSVLLAVHPAPRLQVATISGPTPPGMMGSQPDRHYPAPKGPNIPAPPSSKDIGSKQDRDAIHGVNTATDLMPTDMEDFSLEMTADRLTAVVVSFKRTVRLESGVRLELRVTAQNVAQAP